MEEIYVNVEHNKSVEPRPSTNHTGPSGSQRRFHGAVVLCLGLLSVSLLAGLVGLGVHYLDSVRRSAAELSAINAKLTAKRDRLNASLTETIQELNNLDSVRRSAAELSAIVANLTAERDRLNASLTETTKDLNNLDSVRRSAAELSAIVANLTAERDRLNASLTETTKELNKRACPAGWRWFGCSCYLLSEESGSWENGRKDCRDRKADLVVISSSEQQVFLSHFTEEETQAWIGLTDRVQERTWKWIDGAPLSLKYWQNTQPDNGGGHGELGEEDCAHITTGGTKLKNWNDLSCDTSLRWICEKRV